MFFLFFNRCVSVNLWSFFHRFSSPSVRLSRCGLYFHLIFTFSSHRFSSFYRFAFIFHLFPSSLRISMFVFCWCFFFFFNSLYIPFSLRILPLRLSRLFSVHFQRVLTFSSRLPLSAFPFGSHLVLCLFYYLHRGFACSLFFVVPLPPLTVRLSLFLCACFFFFPFSCIYLPLRIYIFFSVAFLFVLAFPFRAFARQRHLHFGISNSKHTHIKKGKERKKKVRIYFTYMAKISA